MKLFVLSFAIAAILVSGCAETQSNQSGTAANVFLATINGKQVAVPDPTVDEKQFVAYAQAIEAAVVEDLKAAGTEVAQANPPDSGTSSSESVRAAGPPVGVPGAGVPAAPWVPPAFLPAGAVAPGALPVVILAAPGGCAPAVPVCVTSCAAASASATARGFGRGSGFAVCGNGRRAWAEAGAEAFATARAEARACATACSNGFTSASASFSYSAFFSGSGWGAGGVR